MVGARGFEPRASRVRAGCSSQAELHPDWCARGNSNSHVSRTPRSERGASSVPPRARSSTASPGRLGCWGDRPVSNRWPSRSRRDALPLSYDHHDAVHCHSTRQASPATVDDGVPSCASLVKQQPRSLGRSRRLAFGQTPSFAAALPEVAFQATKNPTKLVANGGARWGPDCGPVAWRQVTIVPPEPHRGARLGLSRRG